MKIADSTFVSIEYRLTLDSGQVVDSSSDGKPLSFITGTGRILPGLEKALLGRLKGDSTEVTLDPEEAYGPVNEKLFQEIPKSNFPPAVEVKPGAAFQAQGHHGPVMIRVSKVEGDTVTVDLNHPMAGKRLHFDVKIVEVREPLEEELSQISEGCGCGSPDQQEGGCQSGCQCG